MLDICTELASGTIKNILKILIFGCVQNKPSQ